MGSDKEKQATVDVNTLLKTLKPNVETVMDVFEDNLGGKKVQFGYREMLPEEPEIARPRARDHEFHSIDAFCEYVSREASQNEAMVLADMETLSMVATLDESSEFDHEFIFFSALVHPMFQKWRDLLGKSTKVLEFALFVMQQRSSVLHPEGHELALLFSQIKASKSITKRAGIGKKSLNGVMIELQIGSEKNEMEVELPERVTIEAPLFLDTDPIQIDLDLLVTEDSHGDLVVFVTAPHLEEEMLRVFQRMVDKVRSQAGVLVGLGRVRERDWRVVC